MKKGFTLIELLAVIVILAIIALIATPIVLSIINNSKESAQLRSAEMYLKGVETSVATAIIHEKNVKDGTHPITPTGDICLGTLQGTGKTATCNGEVLEVQMNGEKPESGTVTIESGKIKDIAFTYSNGKTIVKDAGKLVYDSSEAKEEEEGTTQVYEPQYYSWLSGNIKGDLPSDATTNAQDIMNTSGYSHYLGLDVDSSDKVTAAYVCFTKNGIEYCLKVGDAGASYELNQNILKEAFEDSECSSQPVGFACYAADGLSVNANSDGSGASSYADGECVVYNNGYFMCGEH